MGNNNTKMIVGGVAGTLAVSSLVYYMLSTESTNYGSRRPGGLHTSPVISPKSHKARHFTPQQLAMLDSMENHYVKKVKGSGKYLEAVFFEDFQELLYLRSREKHKELMNGAIEAAALDFKKFKFTDYHKKVKSLAEKISDLEEAEADRISDVFDDTAFITASRIYLIRYDCDSLIRATVIGSRLKHEHNLKVVNQFNIGQIVKFVKAKITSRLEQGFDNVDKTYFPTEFRLQLETEVLGKFNAGLDELWAFCVIEDIGADKAEWDSMISEYCRMLKTFYHGMTLYTPGIKVL